MRHCLVTAAPDSACNTLAISARALHHVKGDVLFVCDLLTVTSFLVTLTNIVGGPVLFVIFLLQ